MNGDGVQLGLLALGDDLGAERPIQLGHRNGCPVLIVRRKVHVPRQPVDGKTFRVGQACGNNEITNECSGSSLAPLPLVIMIMMMTFSSLARTLGEGSMIQSQSVFFYIFKWRSTCAHKWHILGQDQSTETQQAEVTGRAFPDKLCVGSLDRFPTLCLDSIANPLRLCWVKGVCVSRYNATCHLYFWQNDWGLLCATVVT